MITFGKPPTGYLELILPKSLDITLDGQPCLLNPGEVVSLLDGTEFEYWGQINDSCIVCLSSDDIYGPQMIDAAELATLLDNVGIMQIIDEDEAVLFSAAVVEDEL